MKLPRNEFGAAAEELREQRAGHVCRRRRLPAIAAGPTCFAAPKEDSVST